MRVLVTGSSGFIGRHLVRKLEAEGHSVIGLDRLPTGDAVSGTSSRTVDILDRQALLATFANARPDAVVHLAARTDIDEKRDLAGYATNIAGVENIVEATKATPGVHRVIYTSSQLVCRVGYVPKSDDDYRPNTLYGESKVASEKLVRASGGGGVDWCLVRPTTVWGPGMGPHYQRFFRMIAEGRYFHVGRRPLYKSYGYVGNVVHQYAKLLTAEPAAIARKTMYIADYEPLSLRAWADGFQRALGAPPIRTLPEPIARAGATVGDVLNRIGWRRFPYNSFRLGNVLTEYVFDLEPIRKIAGQLPSSVDEGIRATVAWLREVGVVATPAVRVGPSAPIDTSR